ARHCDRSCAATDCRSDVRARSQWRQHVAELVRVLVRRQAPARILTNSATTARIPRLFFRHAQSVVQPGAGVRPVPGRPGPRDSKDIGGFLLIQPGEKAELDELCLFGLLDGKLLQGFVELNDVLARSLDRQLVFTEIDSLAVAPVAQAFLAARALDQNPSHGL